MRDGGDRRPDAVPDALPDGEGSIGADQAGHGVPVPGFDVPGFDVHRFDVHGFDVHGGADTDLDGLPDTLVGPDGPDLCVLTDLDGDGLADRLLRIGPDGAVHATYLPGGGPFGDLFGPDG